MKIQNLLTRHPETGSQIEFGTPGGDDHVVYNFLPNEKGHEVCEVEDKAHIKRLLSITEAYTPYLEEDKKAVKKTAAKSSQGDSAGEDEEEGEGEGVTDAETAAKIDSMQKPELMAWVQENLPDLVLKPTMQVNAMRVEAKAAWAAKQVADKK